MTEFDLRNNIAELEAKVLTLEKLIEHIIKDNKLSTPNLEDESAKQKFIARTKYKIIP